MKTKVNIKKVISLATSLMLVASMALATQGEVKVEGDTVTLGGSQIKVPNGDVSIANSEKFYVGGGSGDTVIGSLGNEAGALQLKSDGTRDVNIGSNSYPGAISVEGSNGNVSIQKALTVGQNDGANILLQSGGSTAFRMKGGGSGSTVFTFNKTLQFGYEENAGFWPTKTVMNLYTNGNVSIPNGDLVIDGSASGARYLKIRNNGSNIGDLTKLDFQTNEGENLKSRARIDAGREGTNGGSFGIYTRNNGNMVRGLLIDSNQKVTIPGELWVEGGRVTSSGSNLNADNITQGEVNKDRLWKNKGTEVTYSGGATDTGTSYAGATVMASGTFTQNGGDTTVTLPFDWSGGILHVWISHVDYLFAQNTGTVNTGQFKTTYDALTNSKYTGGQLIMHNHSVNTAQFNKGGVGGAPKSAGPDYFVIQGGGTYYVKWQVIAPMK